MRLPTHYRLSFFLLVASALLAGVGVAAGCWGGAGNAMRARFDKIGLGMNDAEVNGIMAAEGVPLLKGESQQPAQGPWLWSAEGGRVVVWFEDGSVIAKDFTESPREPLSRRIWKWIGR